MLLGIRPKSKQGEMNTVRQNARIMHPSSDLKSRSRVKFGQLSGLVPASQYLHEGFRSQYHHYEMAKEMISLLSRNEIEIPRVQGWKLNNAQRLERLFLTDGSNGFFECTQI